MDSTPGAGTAYTQACCSEWRTFSSVKGPNSCSGSGSLGASGAAPMAMTDTRTAFFTPCSSGADADTCKANRRHPASLFQYVDS